MLKTIYRVLMLLLSITAGSTFCATIYVNSDTGNDATGNGSPGSPYQTITRGLQASVNGDIIDITGIFTGEGSSVSGITVNKQVTIQGRGTDITIVQAAATRYTADRRVFTIGLGSYSNTAYFKNFTIRYGYVTGGSSGAGIMIDNATLDANGCSIEENDINIPGQTPYYGAGGIFVHDYGRLIMSNSSVQYNTARVPLYGAAGIYFYSYYGSYKSYITNSTISGNSATYTYSWDFDKSYSGVAGGINNWYSNGLEITNCTIAHNTTSNDGGGLILSYPTIITNCTIAENSASDKGGGLVIIGGNRLTIKNSIIANNSAVNEADYRDVNRNASGALTSNGYNIAEYTALIFSGVGDITGDQSSLYLSSILEPNNNPNGVNTLRTLSGSVAINAGSGTANGSVSIPAYDQRGAPRNGSVDIGAYEYWTDDGALPVELVSFSARRIATLVRLVWRTATEKNNYGFEIERRILDEWDRIGFVEGAGTRNAPMEYTFTDVSLPINMPAAYRLRQLDRDGASEYSNIVEVNANPGGYELTQNWPNPFNPSTYISFTLPADEYISIQVIDALGREVALPANGVFSAGTHTVSFSRGAAPSGIYLYTLRAGTFTDTKRLVIME